MTFVKTKLRLAQLQAGDILEVLLAEGEPLENVPRSATEQGYKVLSVEPVGNGVHKVTIEYNCLFLNEPSNLDGVLHRHADDVGASG